ncbi:MAG: right-handed parallel beta-helix repeat-containing protein [Planctomycetes bacterium]|nr:right-handed parallel beta-helix repeat-containing protein [Planctomycetota bacterium]
MHNFGECSPVVTNCTFSGNWAGNWGGGMFNFDLSNPALLNCLFTGNSANEGGGIYDYQSSPALLNTTMSNNLATTGGAMFSFGTNSVPRNATLRNCVVYFNSADGIFDDPDSTTTISYSDVEGGWPGIGNIDADPMFVAPGNGDYRLSAGSPCIDAANNWGVPVDVNDYDEDGVTNELFPVDLDGNPRFNADENDFDPGCGVPVVVDMGAYEYQFDPVEDVIFADLNGDGSVGVVDLLGLLGGWGPCAKGCCLADLDLDGAVGASDLLILLANWG